MRYNIVLIPDEKTAAEIRDFYRQLKKGINPQFGLEDDSIPHITIAKFESAEDIAAETLDSIIKELDKDIIIEFAGLTILPSRDAGCWIEISILKNEALSQLQEGIIKKLENYNILSGIRDRFRPHITLAKTEDDIINIQKLNHALLRKKNISCTLTIGTADDTFEFYRFKT